MYNQSYNTLINNEITLSDTPKVISVKTNLELL